MPHLRLEASENVAVDRDPRDLLLALHRMLHEVGGIKLENCKSRFIRVDDYAIADGGPGKGGRERAFIHLDVRFLDGRSAEVRQAVGRSALALLLEFFSWSVEALDLQVTVEVRDIDRQFYAKYPEGTLTTQ